MSATLEQLKERIEFFKKNIKDYKSGKYDEYKTRADFIDVFFSSLGWDMYNEQKIIEQFREVVREDKIVIDGNRKAPDYSFRIGPHIVFYVEAKKPSVDIKNDPTPALQLRRYAHTRGLALSILTDFEEIAVYDTRIKPDKKDSAHTARVFYCTYDELFSPCKIQDYSSNYDFLLNTFAKQAVLSGSFNKYVEANKKGTTSVDRGFLDLLNRWREKLAESIALKNEDIDEYNLNIVVQKLIDRLIFLRIAEDRLIEKPNLLFELTGEKDIYIRLCNIFVTADLKYNSSLFLSEDWMMALNIEDKVLKEIIDEMYPPQCPYEFSVLPIEILGHAYEQFLGKTIRFSRKTKFGHSVEIEEKPEVRKAGGVYYTPDYIVDYIVENTVGVKLNNRSVGPLTPKGDKAEKKGKIEKAEKGIKPLTPEEITAIRILDPACGSGSFLIGAYNYLLRYHLEYYLKNKTRREKALSAGIIYEFGENSFKLSTKVKSQILVNNIFGVDIDQQAVEVTKLSLLLKVLEDENLEYKEKLFKTEQLHMLPDLSCNIKCGNSLIGSDYYEDKNLTMFGTTEMRKVNVFDWEKEFKGVFSRGGAEGAEKENGGFDCVIGNPPWGAYLDQQVKKYLQDKYSSFNGNFDSYLFFIDKVIQLSRKNSLISFITPDTWIRIPQASNLRKIVLNNTSVNLITVLPDKVFKGVSANCIIFVIGQDTSNEVCLINILENENELSNLNNLIFTESYYIDSSCWKQSDDSQFQVFQKQDTIDTIKKIKDLSIPLKSFIDVMQGIVPYSRETHSEEIVENRLFHSSKKISDEYGIWIKGRAISRYNIDLNNIEYLKYGSWLHRARKEKYFKGPRILIQEITGGQPPRVSACYFDSLLYHDPGIISCLNVSSYHIYFFLGIINSNFLSWYHRINSPKGKRKSFPKVLIGDIRDFPIPTIDLDNNDQKVSYYSIISLVDSMLESQKQLHTAKSDSDKKILQQKIDAIDKQIDRLVYELYGLTEDEIKIVEGTG